MAHIRTMTEDHELDGWNADMAIGSSGSPWIVLRRRRVEEGRAREDRAALRHRTTTPTARDHLSAIASSDRLIKDADILQVWLKVARQVQAVEMESAGVYRAAQGRQVPVVAIRGISDVVGFKRHADWTEYACHSAASFTLAFLRARPIQPRGGYAADGTVDQRLAREVMEQTSKILADFRERSLAEPEPRLEDLK